MRRKGTLELGMQAIVVIVVAVVLLGLAITFIRGTFKNIGGTTSEIQEAIKKQVLNKLFDSDEKIAFSTDEVEIGTKETKVIGVGIKNDEVGKKYFTIKVIPFSSDNPLMLGEDQEDISDDGVKLFYAEGDVIKIEPQEADVREIRFTSKSIKGTIIYKVIVYIGDTKEDALAALEEEDEEKEYISDDIYVTVQ